MSQTRRLAAILAADVAGYSRLIGADEGGTLERLRALRRDILLGVLKPGTKISQQQLTELYGTSRMPVRDALRLLVHEGLMTVDDSRHTDDLPGVHCYILAQNEVPHGARSRRPRSSSP